MTTKHTPGPWTITREDIESGEIALHITHKLTNVCVVYSYDREDKKRNEQADAHLIAAAPDLLAACTLALDIMEQTNKMDIPPLAKFIEVKFAPEDVAVLRAAIAKAKGETT